MVNTHPAAGLSETARERETFKYDTLTLSTAGLNSPNTPKPIPSTFLASTPDPGLTAFAQLGLYRLNAARANISLFDRSFQHIVAEALRPPATTPGLDGEPAQVWFNGLTFERSSSVCEHVVTGAANTQYIPGTELGLTADDIPVSIIKNLNSDGRFCHIRDPGRQFYAGVPIRTPTGINIGVYCVFDDKPRPEGLSDDEVRFIREISRVVMDYLESKRSHEWYRREQRMIRGLGSFVKGQPTLWNSAESTSENRASYEDIPGMSEGMLNKKLQTVTVGMEGDEQPQPQHPATRPYMDAPVASDVPAANDMPVADNLLVANDLPATNDVSVAEAQQNQNGLGHDETNESASNTERTDFATVPKVAPAPAPAPAAPGPGPKAAQSYSTSGDKLRSNMDRVFSKAANVVRESIEVEGVLFLDGSVRTYGGFVGKIPSDAPNQFEARQSSTGPSSGDEASRSQNCDILGFSTSHSSSIVGDAPPSQFVGCREWFLQRLMRRYPLGQVWNLEADGSVSDHTTDSDDSPFIGLKTPTSSSTADSFDDRSTASSFQSIKRLNTVARIGRMFPGARSVAMVPLWDTQTGRWFAGGFAWTQTPTRTFTEENELTYLRVFGLTAMTEVARLKMRAADKAKTDILGSISHELRSPLHGLVGAVELLRHTDLNALQDGILRTIEASGRTLLDTIDHLLDFVKVNAKQSLKTKRRSRATGLRHSSCPPPADTPSPPEVPIQLDLLVEEVVESVLAGSSYLIKSETYSSTSITSMRSPIADGLSQGRPASAAGVEVFLDIEHPATWSFCMHPGAFRRIVMNLVGNSLKFTKSGFIRVKLRQQSHPQEPSVAGTTRVVLSVSDSGKGMSEDFIRHSLFTPFSQEDQFAPGTGLGLSLVRNMAVMLGGTIDVSSKVRVGTTFTVALPLPRAAMETTGSDEADFWHNIKTLARKRVRLCGLERETKTRNNFREDDSKQRSQFQLVKSICRNMLDMDVLTAHSGSSAVPDVVVCVAGTGEPDYLDFESTKHASQCPYILVCRDLESAYRLTDTKRGLLPKVYEICLQPIGPRKLASAMLACQLRWQAAQGSRLDPTSKPKELDGTATVQQGVGARGLELTPTDATLQHVQEIQKVEHSLPIAADSPFSILPVQQPLSMQSIDALTEKVKSIDLGPINPESRKPILVVDDNDINLKIMAAYLTKLKYTYTTAINGLDALETYTNAPTKYSCLLTDISMPIMDGLESTRRVREFEKANGHEPIVVIALTGLSGSEIRENALASGVDLFLTRPLPFRGLKEALVAVGLT